MRLGDRTLPPLARFGDAHGSVIFGWVAPQVLYARVDGQLSDRLASTYAGQLERAIWSAKQVRLFTDLWQLETYSSPARDALLAVTSEQKKRFEAVDVLVRSTVVTLGVKAAAIVLGSIVQIHTRPASFTALLQQHAPHARALLEPSIGTKPDVSWQ